MKRDWDCIRAILLALESKGDLSGLLRQSDNQGFDEQTTAYNMKLLLDHRLVEGQCLSSLGFDVTCAISSMTWNGHKLLDTLRSQTLWNRIKAVARERAIPLSFDAVKLLGAEALKSLIGSG
jgi:hypothetical protein